MDCSENDKRAENATQNVERQKSPAKKRRRGHFLYKGVLSSEEGITYLQEYESKPGSFQTTSSQVETFTPQGVRILEDKVIGSEREVADPKLYFTMPRDTAVEAYHADVPVFV